MAEDWRAREHAEQQPARAIDRRVFMRRAAALGMTPTLAATLAACGSDGSSGSSGAAADTAAPEQVGGALAKSDEVPGPPWKGGTRGGTLSVGFADEGPSFDPATSFDGVAYLGGVQLFYRNLTVHNEKLEPELDLAEDMDVSSDAKRYLFKIRKGVAFHDGSELTAKDVEASLLRTLDAKTASWGAGYISSIAGAADFTAGKTKGVPGIRVRGTHDLELTLDRPDVALPAALVAMPFAILPAAALSKGGKLSFPEVPGTGPFKLDRVDRGGNQLVASRNEDYVYAQHVPYFDSVNWRWAVGDSTAVLQVRRGELDHTGNTISAATRLQLEKSGMKEQLLTIPSLNIPMIEFNLSAKPFDDPKVRQAFNHALDRNRLKRFAINPTGHMLPPTLLGYDDALETYAYDPERARALLKEAGQSNLEFTLPFFAGEIGSSDGIVNENVLPLLAQDLQAVGVKMNLKRVAGDFYSNVQDLKDYGAWVKSWSMGFADPAELVANLLRTGAGSNYGGYSNERVDELGVQGEAEADRGKRGDIYAEIEKTVLADAPYLFIGAFNTTLFHVPELRNVHFDSVMGTHASVAYKA